MMDNSFQSTLNNYFPDSMKMADFVTDSSVWLNGLGFSAENTIASAIRCRDELTLALVDALQPQWGPLFDMASLGGFVFTGKTGFGAALAHAPNLSRQPRCLFFAFPHIGINADGHAGVCQRPGQSAETTACGALVALHKLHQAGSLNPAFVQEDIEFSLMQQRMIPVLGDAPVTLIQTTKLAQEAISADLHHMIELTVKPKEIDYAVITGVQIHAPNQETYISLSSAYAVVGEQRHLWKGSGESGRRN